MNEEIFNNKGKIYAKYRPTYPRSLFNYLHCEYDLNSSSKIADIGSGTGIFSKCLSEYCNTIYAVEPNEDMRNAAKRVISNHHNIISINGTAENTTLSNKSVDFVTAAQSFHWFDRQIFKTECKRILKQNGKVILIWNCRDENDNIVLTIDNINRKYCPDFSGTYNGMRGEKTKNDFSDFFFEEYEIKLFENHLELNEEYFIGWHLSASYCPNPNESTYLPYINELKSFFNSNCQSGKIIIPNYTKLYIGNI